MTLTHKSPELSSLTRRIAGPEAKAWAVTDRANALDESGEDIIHLGIGDPDMDTHETIRDALIESLQKGRTHYPPLAGEPLLRAEISRHCSEFYGRLLKPEQVTVFPGVQTALYSTMQCVAETGDEVILLQPTYATYPAVVQATGADIVYVPLDAKTDFQLNINLIANAITERTRAILLNSPSNPSGAMFSKGEVQALVEICKENGIWLISDEVYATLVFDGEFTSPLHIADTDSCVVVLRSLSKSHAMSGWRLGWAIAPDVLATSLQELSQPMLFGVSQFTQDAAITALKNSDVIVPEIRDVFHLRRDVLCDRLEKIPGLTVYRPSGGMFALVDISVLGCDGETFANQLLDEAGVSVVPGFAFGASTVNCVRIGFCQDIKLLEEAATRIEKFVRAKQRSGK
jgi:arginine:pyruvate transaminase